MCLPSFLCPPSVYIICMIDLSKDLQFLTSGFQNTSLKARFEMNDSLGEKFIKLAGKLSISILTWNCSIVPLCTLTGGT